MGIRSDPSGDDAGTVLIEMAILVTLLLVMATSVVEVGRFLAVWHGTHAAAESAAAFGTGTEDGRLDCNEITWAAVFNSGLAELQPTEVEVTHLDASGTRIHTCGDTNIDPDPAQVGAGTQVVVTVHREVTAVTPLARPFLGPFAITATASATVNP